MSEIRRLAVELAIATDRRGVRGPDGPLFVAEWESLLRLALMARKS